MCWLERRWRKSSSTRRIERARDPAAAAEGRTEGAALGGARLRAGLERGRLVDGRRGRGGPGLGARGGGRMRRDRGPQGGRGGRCRRLRGWRGLRGGGLRGGRGPRGSSRRGRRRGKARRGGSRSAGGFQGGQKLRPRGLLLGAGGDGGDAGLDGVQGLEEEVRLRPAGAESLALEPGGQALRGVRDGRNGLQLEHAGVALDRMEGPHQGVDGLGAAAVLELERRVDGLLHELVAFEDKAAEGFKQYLVHLFSPAGRSRNRPRLRLSLGGGEVKGEGGFSPWRGGRRGRGRPRPRGRRGARAGGTRGPS